MNYDYTVKTWVNGECVYDSTKGGWQKYKTTNINKAPKSIKGDYDLSIHGNKIVLVDNSDGTTIETKCHPDDKFDIGLGVKEAFNKLDEKRKELEKAKEEENKINVGDLVEIINIGKNYATYYQWIPSKEFNLIKQFEYGGRPHSKMCKVLYLGKHLRDNVNLAYVQDTEGMCHTMNVTGLKKVK